LKLLSPSIEIKNWNDKNSTCARPYDVRVDRTHVLGNPFFMKDESQRNYVCDQYEIWINQQIALKNKKIINALKELKNKYKTYGRLRLFCWCAPKRCHAETIRKLILNS
jgi:hypothetical protein